MKIISFLLIFAITCQAHQLLDQLKLTSFGQSLEQTILLQLQYDDTKLKSILQEIQTALDEEQIQDNINFKQEYDGCNNNDLQNEIIAIKYEHSSINQKIKMLNNSFEFQVMKQKQKELQYNQEQFEVLLKQLDQEKQFEESNINECDELLKLLQYLRFQFERKVQSQFSVQKNQLVLLQMKQELQENYKVMHKLIKKQSFNTYIKLLIQSFDENIESIDKYQLTLIRLLKIIQEIIKIIEQSKEQIRQQYDLIIEKEDQLIHYFQKNISDVLGEINLLNNQQKQIEKDTKYFTQQLNQINQILEMKNNLLKDKQIFCESLKDDYTEYRAFRDAQREQLQQIITLVERNIFEIKDYYTSNGRLRQ